MVTLAATTALSQVLYISVGAVLGVLTRAGLGRAFGPAGLAVTSPTGPLFVDLPANAVGCFLAGAYTPWKTRSATLHPGFPHAISTGFLGSVTTFASWNLQATRMLVAGDVAAAIAALLLGVSVALSSYGAGGDAARAAERLRASFCERQSTASAHGAAHNGEASSNTNTSVGVSACAHETHRVPPSDKPEVDDEEAAAAPTVAVAASSTAARRRHREAGFPALCATVLFGLLSVALVLYTRNPSGTRSSLYLSVLLSPVGALGRWQLAVLLNRPSAIPWGTLTANSVAAALDGALAAALARGNPGRAAVAALNAGVTGLGGSLSTASTWTVELVGLPRGAAYAYGFGSLAAAQLIGIAAYGGAVWSA